VDVVSSILPSLAPGAPATSELANGDGATDFAALLGAAQGDASDETTAAATRPVSPAQVRPASQPRPTVRDDVSGPDAATAPANGSTHAPVVTGEGPTAASTSIATLAVPATLVPGDAAVDSPAARPAPIASPAPDASPAAAPAAPTAPPTLASPATAATPGVAATPATPALDRAPTPPLETNATPSYATITSAPHAAPKPAAVSTARTPVAATNPVAPAAKTAEAASATPTPAAQATAAPSTDGNPAANPTPAAAPSTPSAQALAQTAAASNATTATEAATAGPRAGRDAAKDLVRTSKTAAKPAGAKLAAGDAGAQQTTKSANAADAGAKPAQAAQLMRAGAAGAGLARLAEPAEPSRAPGAEAALDVVEASDVQRADAARTIHAPERAAAQTRTHGFDVAAFATRFAARVVDGGTRFSIRLDPPELGRVDVRLEVSADGVAQARLLAERPEALAELARHARALERQLADAGVDLAKDGLRFELAGREGGDARERDHGHADEPRAAARVAERIAPAAVADALAEVDTAYGFTILRRGRLDVTV
jgi:flagellar hook-length control protein FliK